MPTDDIVAPTDEPDFVHSLQGFASMCESSGRTGGMSPEDCEMVAGKLRDACFVIDELQKLRDGKMSLGWQLVPATALTERDAQIERLKSELEDERAEVKRLSGDPPADWGEVATMIAEQVMIQLGRAPEASRDPGIDPRRDRICVLIESALNARAITAERDLAEARAEVERVRSERSYIIGWNDGFAEAQEQQSAEMAKGGTDAEA